jgi:hypothetical protein
MREIQELARPYIREEVSLSEELLQERRAEAERD